MAYHGVNPPQKLLSPVAYLVTDYFNRKLLRSLGLTFPNSEISEFDLQIYTAISQEYNKLEKQSMEKRRK